MAVISPINCRTCGTNSYESHRPGDPPPIDCGPCRGKAQADARQEQLDEIAALPVEERLRRIEAWIYDYRPQHVPPPRF